MFRTQINQIRAPAADEPMTPQTPHTVQARLVSEQGEEAGPPIDLPVGVTVAQLGLICNALLQNVYKQFLNRLLFKSNLISYFFLTAPHPAHSGRTNTISVLCQRTRSQRNAKQHIGFGQCRHRGRHQHRLSATSRFQSPSRHTMHKFNAWPLGSGRFVVFFAGRPALGQRFG